MRLVGVRGRGGRSALISWCFTFFDDYPRSYGVYLSLIGSWKFCLVGLIDATK